MFNETNEVNTLKWEHLSDSKYYILSGLYNWSSVWVSISSIISDPKYIDYYMWNKDIARQNLTARIDNAFVFSRIDWTNKFSKTFRNCTWIVAIWEDKNTWENISFLTHQNTIPFLKQKFNFDKKFWDRLLEKIVQLKDMSKEGTVDIVIIGWNDLNNWKDYKETIKFLDRIIKDEIWFSPTVIWWPTLNMGQKTFNDKHIAIDTNKRFIHYFKEYSSVEENIHFVTDKVDSILKVGK